MNDLWSFGGYAIAAVVFLGTAFVYLRGSSDKGTLESQGRLIETRGAEIADLTRRVESLETENTTLRFENATLHRAVAHVEELVQLQQSVEHLRDASDNNHSESIAVLGRILVALEALAA